MGAGGGEPCAQGESIKNGRMVWQCREPMCRLNGEWAATAAASPAVRITPKQCMAQVQAWEGCF